MSGLSRDPEKVREWQCRSRRNNPLDRSTPLTRDRRMRKRNPERKKRRRERDFGEKAAWIAAQRCDGCGAPPPSDPHHHPSRGAGGTKKDLMPLCRECHDDFHQHGAETWVRERLIQPKTLEWLTETTEYWEDLWQRRQNDG